MTSGAEHRAELVAGAIVLAVAAGFLFWGFGKGFARETGYEVRASFPDVDGVPATYMADARLTIPADIALPSDSAALIQSDGLLGGAYIQIQPGGSADNLVPGDEIEDVQGAVSLLQLMMKFVDSQAGDEENS